MITQQKEREITNKLWKVTLEGHVVFKRQQFSQSTLLTALRERLEGKTRY